MVQVNEGDKEVYHGSGVGGREFVNALVNRAPDCDNAPLDQFLKAKVKTGKRVGRSRGCEPRRLCEVYKTLEQRWKRSLESCPSRLL
jgi:hypothetical protein